jgi:hypothetical protein
MFEISIFICVFELRSFGIAANNGFAVRGFSATLTRDLYICCRNGLTESVPKRTVIWL